MTVYLRRLGLEADLPATVETLVVLHRSHLETVPYENLGIMLGRAPSVDPLASLRRVGEVGRAGYCFHQNGALELALHALGYSVSRRHGHVYTDGRPDPDGALNHLALVVDGLPTEANPGGRWWVDVGLGDAFRDPVPVVAGEVEQGGFVYQVTDVRADGWSFRHDASGSFSGLEVSSRPTGLAAVETTHAGLSAPGTGHFARLLVVQRRDATGVDTVRGWLWHRTEAEGRSETELTTYDTWRSALADGTRLPLGDVDDGELHALYARQRAAHEAWTAAGRP